MRHSQVPGRKVDLITSVGIEQPDRLRTQEVPDGRFSLFCSFVLQWLTCNELGSNIINHKSCTLVQTILAFVSEIKYHMVARDNIPELFGFGRPPSAVFYSHGRAPDAGPVTCKTVGVLWIVSEQVR